MVVTNISWILLTKIKKYCWNTLGICFLHQKFWASLLRRREISKTQIDTTWRDKLAATIAPNKPSSNLVVQICGPKPYELLGKVCRALKKTLKHKRISESSEIIKDKEIGERSHLNAIPTRTSSAASVLPIDLSPSSSSNYYALIRAILI